MAALAGNLCRLSWGGKHFGTESWTNTLHFDSPTTAQPNPTAMHAAMMLFQLLMGNSSQIDYWKYNVINPATGKYAGTDSNTYSVVPPLTGSRSDSIPQACVVVSLLTDSKRGPAHAGRLYLPLGGAVSSLGLMPKTTVDGYEANFVDFMKAVVATKTHLPVVWSPKYQQVNVIRQAGIGQVIDTQRRRRKSLKELTDGISIT